VRHRLHQRAGWHHPGREVIVDPAVSTVRRGAARYPSPDSAASDQARTAPDPDTRAPTACTAPVAPTRPTRDCRWPSQPTGAGNYRATLTLPSPDPDPSGAETERVLKRGLVWRGNIRGPLDPALRRSLDDRAERGRAAGQVTTRTPRPTIRPRTPTRQPGTQRGPGSATEEAIQIPRTAQTTRHRRAPMRGTRPS